MSEQLQNPGLLRRERVPLLAHRILPEKRDDALLERGGHPERPQLSLDAVRELGERSLGQDDVLRGGAARPRVVGFLVVLEKVDDRVFLLVGEEKAALIPKTDQS